MSKYVIVWFSDRNNDELFYQIMQPIDKTIKFYVNRQ